VEFFDTELSLLANALTSVQTVTDQSLGSIVSVVLRYEQLSCLISKQGDTAAAMQVPDLGNVGLTGRCYIESTRPVGT
jgi:hypothetical protein